MRPKATEQRQIQNIHETMLRIKLIWEKHPEKRLGQLILESFQSEGLLAIYSMPDKHLVKTIEQFHSIPRKGGDA